MEIKYTIQGFLIYLAISLYLLAFIMTMLRCKKSGRSLFLLGFIIATCSFAYRWYHVKHVPMQNLFEVFLTLGVLIYPISRFCRDILHIGGESADMLIGVIVLIPAGFIFNAEPQFLPPALQCWLFTPHVAVYMLSYVFMAKAAFQAAEVLVPLQQFSDKNIQMLPPEQAGYQLVSIGFPLLTLGLLLGSWWGKLAWGDYWGWDPKELWSLASWLIYVGYFHFRYLYGKKRPRANSIWIITGMAVIIITLLWVNLSKLFSGLHSYAT